MIKSLLNRDNILSKASKITRRGHILQTTTENSQVLKTPPRKIPNRLITEKTIAGRNPLQPLNTRNAPTKVVAQVIVSNNKENEAPRRSEKSQKPAIIIIKVQSQDNVKEAAKCIKEKVKSGSTKSQEDLNYYERVVEPIEIGADSSLDLDLLLEIDYGNDIEDDIFANQPDFSDCLSQTEIKKFLRAKMVDWMIEVLGNYWQTTSHQTLFLSVAILDLYLKHSTKKLYDSDLHIAGIACMFLASKYDDVYHIPLSDFVTRVGHNKFSADQIKTVEWEILKALDYNISFPTVLTYFERLVYRNFHEDSCNMLKNIKEAATHILKMCLHEYLFVNFPPLTLALAVLCYCIKCYFYSLSEENNKNGNHVDFQEQEDYLLQNILKNCSQVKVKDAETCMHRINELTHEFDKRFPGLYNLMKFSKLQSK